MNKQKLSKRLKQKFSSYFKSLCSIGQNNQIESSEQVKQLERKSVIKRRRSTFVLNQVLIKLSRKNIILQQFQIYSYGLQIATVLEKHISHRLKNITIAIFQGNFTQHSMNTVLFPIKLITKQIQFLNSGNFIRGSSIKIGQDCIDAYVLQIAEEPYKNIEATLNKHHKQINRFIFICPGELQSQQLFYVLVNFRYLFLFEIQRIMNLNKCVNTIIYASSRCQFLHIDQEPLVDFYILESSKLHPQLDKLQFRNIISSILDNGFYIQVANTLAEIFSSSKTTTNFITQFIRSLEYKFPHVVPSLKGLDDGRMFPDELSRQKSMYFESTPLFRFQTRGSYKIWSGESMGQGSNILELPEQGDIEMNMICQQ